MTDFAYVDPNGEYVPNHPTAVDSSIGQSTLVAANLVNNPILDRIGCVRSEADTRKILNNDCVPKYISSDATSIEHKIAGLANFQFFYAAPKPAIKFAQRIVAQVRASYELRNPEDMRYVQFVYSQAEVLKGKTLKSMPDFLGSLTGPGFILAGPSGSGKTAFLQRLRFLIGKEAFTIQTNEAEFTVLPLLILRWPDCGTLSGLLVNFRQALEGEVSQSMSNDFGRISGSSAGNAAIAYSVLLNLGLLVIDGMCLRSGRKEYREILDFITTFRERTGIPTLISCTYPALQLISRSGSKQANCGSSNQEYWDLLVSDERWSNICRSIWKVGPMGNEAIPEFLPALLWDVSLGNMRILIAAFTALHHEYAFEPSLYQSLKKENLIEFLGAKLRMFKEPLSVLAQFLQTQSVAGNDLIHADYLPHHVFSNMPSAEFERQLKLSNGSRKIKV